MYLRASVVLTPILAAACFVDSGAPTQDATTTTTTLAMTTGPTSTTTEPTSTSSSTTSESTEETTSEPVDPGCWPQGADNWPVSGVKLDITDITEPYITADGLSLFYLDKNVRRPHRTTRAGRNDTFTAGQVVGAWDSLAADTLVNFPTVVQDGALMLISIDMDVHYAQRTTEVDYSPPVSLTTVNTPGMDAPPTATADAAVLIVQRDDGPPVGTLTNSFLFHQFKRVDGDPVDFAFDRTVTPSVPPYDLALCPALSPDGLRLFFTSTSGDGLDFNKPEDFAVHYTTRDSIDADWVGPTKLGGLVSTDGIACVSSVTTDGCELIYYTVTIASPVSHYIADRTP